MLTPCLPRTWASTYPGATPTRAHKGAASSGFMQAAGRNIWGSCVQSCQGAVPQKQGNSSNPQYPAKAMVPQLAPQGALAQAKPRAGAHAGQAVRLPSALTWRARGAPGPWDAGQYCVHGSRGQL